MERMKKYIHKKLKKTSTLSTRAIKPSSAKDFRRVKAFFSIYPTSTRHLPDTERKGRNGWQDTTAQQT